MATALSEKRLFSRREVLGIAVTALALLAGACTSTVPSSPDVTLQPTAVATLTGKEDKETLTMPGTVAEIREGAGVAPDKILLIRTANSIFLSHPFVQENTSVQGQPTLIEAKSADGKQTIQFFLIGARDNDSNPVLFGERVIDGKIQNPAPLLTTEKVNNPDGTVSYVSNIALALPGGGVGKAKLVEFVTVQGKDNVNRIKVFHPKEQDKFIYQDVETPFDWMAFLTGAKSAEAAPQIFPTATPEAPKATATKEAKAMIPQPTKDDIANMYQSVGKEANAKVQAAFKAARDEVHKITPSEHWENDYPRLMEVFQKIAKEHPGVYGEPYFDPDFNGMPVLPLITNDGGLFPAPQPIFFSIHDTAGTGGEIYDKSYSLWGARWPEGKKPKQMMVALEDPFLVDSLYDDYYSKKQIPLNGGIMMYNARPGDVDVIVPQVLEKMKIEYARQAKDPEMVKRKEENFGIEVKELSERLTSVKAGNVRIFQFLDAVNESTTPIPYHTALKQSEGIYYIGIESDKKLYVFQFTDKDNLNIFFYQGADIVYGPFGTNPLQFKGGLTPSVERTAEKINSWRERTFQAHSSAVPYFLNMMINSGAPTNVSWKQTVDKFPSGAYNLIQIRQ